MDLEYLPNELFNLKTLITLNLSNNKIKEIDKQIENLVNLKDLNLENNDIADLPKEILKLSNLSRLNLNGNSILLKLKDFDVYWKLSLKNYFAADADAEANTNANANKINLNLITNNFYNNNHKVNLVTQEHAQTIFLMTPKKK